MRRLLWCMVLAVGVASLLDHTETTAHEVRPAFLQLAEKEDRSWTMLWKQPVLEGRQLPLSPVFEPACEAVAAGPEEFTGTARLARFTLACDPSTTVLTIQGLSATLTDVMVRIDREDGSTVNHLLRPERPSVDLADPTPAASAYLWLGIEHLLFGIDHVLFVIGLVLFIPGRLDLIKTITAFTLAHSVTLALSVLELVTVPQAPVEAIIALSILFLARELVIEPGRRSLLTTARPWIMALLFGLLHGLGFAGVLSEIGLPRDQLAMSLLLFNVGIEAGQLIVIAVMLALLWLQQRFSQSHTPELAYSWIMGSVAGMWTLDRVFAVIV
ncbi:MAG: HupE/UreJ family protein [Gammaproteobacteria bacterium]|nr:HupE/UreJ family protein [Gammaproteobacteria bacterium]